ncbi:hypothetical protein [Hymenobacter sp. AT01-02]|uniref:hypothetical protein n=1 Tax=Hymenobacter sp. AT01-02 TaxID=1571877 RepID=UPI0005F26094|nr:hypothetical protein [Hymenobacter sp. AT01-02]
MKASIMLPLLGLALVSNALTTSTATAAPTTVIVAEDLRALRTRAYEEGIAFQQTHTADVVAAERADVLTILADPSLSQEDRIYWQYYYNGLGG